MPEVGDQLLKEKMEFTRKEFSKSRWSESHEYSALSKCPPDSKRFLVGAAGLEPATRCLEDRRQPASARFRPGNTGNVSAWRFSYEGKTGCEHNTSRCSEVIILLRRPCRKLPRRWKRSV